MPLSFPNLRWETTNQQTDFYQPPGYSRVDRCSAWRKQHSVNNCKEVGGKKDMFVDCSRLTSGRDCLKTRKWCVVNTWMTRWQSPRHQPAGSYRKALHWRKGPLSAPPMWSAPETWTSSSSSGKTWSPAAGVCSWSDEHQWMRTINAACWVRLQCGGWESSFGSGLIISRRIV